MPVTERELPRASMMRDALGQAVFGVSGPQQEQAEGPQGFKMTLLAYALRNGPFAVSSLVLATALTYSASIFLDSYKELVASNGLLAKSFAELTVMTKDTNGRMEELQQAFEAFKVGVWKDHPEQLRILREIAKGQQ